MSGLLHTFKMPEIVFLNRELQLKKWYLPLLKSACQDLIVNSLNHPCFTLLLNADFISSITEKWPW